jgi:thiol-disulfide isomerase/thioredoxin
MRSTWRCPFVLAVLALIPLTNRAPGAITLRMEEIFDKLSVGYATRLVDVNDDGKLDIVVVDTDRVVWFENPAWRMHTLIEHATKKDNVSIAPYDIDGDGRVDFALASDWRPSDTRASGSIEWLARGKSPDDPWSVHPIGIEPTAHRIRFADLDGDGREELIVVPLFGRNTTAPEYATAAVRILVYRVPRDPLGPWKAESINEDLHVAHNFLPIDLDRDGKLDIVVASFEGLSLLTRDAAGAWKRTLIGSGNQQTSPSRGASEVKHGLLTSGDDYLATIEPWHGFQVVVYTRPDEGGAIAGTPALWRRTVIDEQLKWGHALWCADLDGDGDQELIVGVRDTKDAANPCGLRVYDPLGPDPKSWKKHMIDPGGVAIEDLAVNDLNGDGKPDVVAVGRQTKNVRIYWNETAASSDQAKADDLSYPRDTLADCAGGCRSLDESRGRAGTVLGCISTECPISIEYVPTLNRLAQSFRARGINFIALDPNADEPLDALRNYAREQRLAFPLLKDADARVSRRLRFDVTPEVRVFDAAGKLVYRGRIDDRYRTGAAGAVSSADLERTLDELAAGKAPSVERTKAVGCPLQLAAPR